MNANEIALLDTIALPLFVIEPDENGRTLYVAFNKTGREASGIELEQVLGKTAKEIYPGRLGAIAFTRHVETISAKKATTYELNLPLRGIQRRISTTLVPSVDQFGIVRRLTGSSRDISAESTLREMQIGSEGLDEDMLQFLNLAAHDLSSPMKNVQGLAKLLRDGFVDHGDGKIELIEMLEHIAVKATDLISDVLVHAHTVGAPNAFCRFEFGELCSDILITLDPAQFHDVEFTHGWIEGDHVVTQIALRNLIDNAIKQAPDSQTKLVISAKNRAQETFEITVRDFGSGFKDPSIAFLDTGKLRSECGFGLVGIRRLVDSRGGKITARNSPTGLGAEVRFELPGRFTEFPKPNSNGSNSEAHFSGAG